MNSVHDCGGMDGFGPVVPAGYDGTEPVFKADWERRMLAVFMATIGPLYSDDEFRQSRESLEPAKYMTRSYYEQWWFAVTRLMLEKGHVTSGELKAALGASAGGEGT